MLKGKVTFEALHDWMELNSTNELFLKILNKKKIDLPSESTLHRILINVDNNELETIFRDYFKIYAIGEHIAVDGGVPLEGRSGSMVVMLMVNIHR